MTITILQIWLFIGAMLILVISPGPVVAAIVARVVARGFHAIWPIVLAVMVGDFLWVAIVLFGLGGFVGEHANIMIAVRYIGAAYLIYMGVQEIRHARDKIERVRFGGKSEFFQVFMAGLAIIMTNPKAILFYALFVPQFFDISKFTWIDTMIIALTAAVTAFIGNMIWGGFAHAAAKRIASSEGRAMLRKISGGALIIVALVLVVLK